MERLTDKKEADTQRREYENRLENGYPRNIPEERFLRLAAYEDAGLEPEEIRRMKEYMEPFTIRDIDRFNEIMQAEKDGRLVVLPCKPGTPIWEVGDFYCGNLKRRPFGVDDMSYWRFGITVFLTREEAEAALKKREAGEIDAR